MERNSAGWCADTKEKRGEIDETQISPAKAQEVMIAHIRDPWHALGNLGGAARKRHSDGQGAAWLDVAGGPTLHFLSQLDRTKRVNIALVLLEGHPVIHENAAPCATPEMFQAGIVKRMDEVISLSLVKTCGVRRLDKVMQALERDNLPIETDRVLWLLL